MTTGFGFCPNCGAPLTEAGQRFCAACGFTLPVAEAAAAAITPAVALPPPPAGPPPAPAWAMPPAAPVGAAPAKTAISPAMLLVGGLVIAAIVAVGYFATNGSKPTPTGGPGHSGGLFGSAFPSVGTVATDTPVAATPTPGDVGSSISVKPSTVNCSDTTMKVTLTAWLASSTKASDQVAAELDGQTGDLSAVSDNFEKQSDGRWLSTETQSAPSFCGDIAAGKHTVRILDGQGNVLAQTSFTSTGGAATPAPKPTPTPAPTPGAGGGSLTVDPSTFSCTDTTTQVTMTIILPASLSESAEVTAILDGQTGSTDTVSGAGFAKQADGSWLSTDADSASNVCSAYGAGKHTFGIMDAQGKTLASGSFTATP